MSLNWWIRRIAVRTFGHGPRTVAPPGRLGASLRLIRCEPGAAFRTFLPRVVDATTPTEVASWPLADAQDPDRCVYVLRDAGLYDGDGVIYERPTHCALRDTLDYWGVPPERHPAMGRPRISAPQSLAGTSAFIGGLGGRTFFHFLVETLPQLAVLGPDLGSARRLIVQGYLEPTKEAWLRHAGVRLPITWLQPLDHLLCEELIFCPRVARRFQPSPWSVTALQSLVGAPMRSAGSRRRLIWADRRRSHMRFTSWEADLVAQLPSPWEAVEFSTLSPAQTLALCGECAAFAGLHGAAFANLALCPPGVRVHEFYQEPKESWYPALSAATGHEHFVAMAAIGPTAIREQLTAEARCQAA